jgi:hypothetical protein
MLKAQTTSYQEPDYAVRKILPPCAGDSSNVMLKAHTHRQIGVPSDFAVELIDFIQYWFSS